MGNTKKSVPKLYFKRAGPFIQDWGNVHLNDLYQQVIRNEEN
jgi:hypothetical protein